MARHRRPVNVRDDGLPAVLGPLITAGGVELAVLVDVDSGMVLDAWAHGGEAETSDAEALGARHADVVRALFALAGAPPAELGLTVDGRHHLVRCVADPAGGRLALAVVVSGTPWVVRRVRRHLRQLPDAGLTTGPWILSWAIGSAPAPKPVAERPPDPSAPMPAGGLPPMHDGQPPADPALGTLPVMALGDPVVRVATAGLATPGADSADSAPIMRAAEPPTGLSPADGSAPNPIADDLASEPAAATTGPTATVPDPRRGPAPPSALPPARSAGR